MRSAIIPWLSKVSITIRGTSALLPIFLCFKLNYFFSIGFIIHSNSPRRSQIYFYSNSARISFVACTMCCKLATVSVSPRVFNPQSGFIHTCSTGIFETIKRMTSLISSTLGTRRIQKRTTHSVVLFQ